MPSPSTSALAGTIGVLVLQRMAGGQSALVVQVPWPFMQIPALQKPAAAEQSASVVHWQVPVLQVPIGAQSVLTVHATVSAQRPEETETVPDPPPVVLPPPWSGSVPDVGATDPIVVVTPSAKERMTRSPAEPL